ncbi:MAG: TonB-dependent receptor [Myxococcota bacterium]
MIDPATIVMAGTFFLAAPASAEGCTGIVTGRVVDAASGEALPRATVQLKAGPSVESDEGGRFRLERVCPGRLTLQARRADYRARTETVEVASDETRSVDVVLEPYRVTRMGDVVVEVPRLAPSETQATGALSGASLERTRGRNLADAVAEIPGVTVLRSGGTAKPIVRGQSGSRVLVLFDGVRHEGQDWGLNFGTEIDPFQAGSIAVVKGSAGVRYGPDAIAGVLLVEPPPLLYEPGVRADIDLVGAWNGRRGTVAARLDGAPSIVPGLALRVEGNYSRGRALETPDYPLDNTGIEEWNLGGKIGYRRPGFEVELSYSHLDLAAGLCTCTRIASPGDFQAQVELDRPLGEPLFNTDAEVERPFQDVTHDRAIARVRAELFDLGSLELTYAYQLNLREEFDVVRQAVSGPQADFELRTHSGDLVFRHRPVRLGTKPVLTGLAGCAFQFQENLFSGLPLIPNFRSIGGGIFVIERLSVGDFEVEAGARFDFLERDTFLTEPAFQRHLSRETLDPNDCESSGGAARCPNSFQAASFTLGGIWRATEALTTKLDLSSAARIPTMDEQFINGTAASFPVLGIGDPGLGPETSWSVSGTVIAETGWLSAEASGYWSFIDDYIYFAPELNAAGDPVIDVLVAGAFPRFSYRPVDAVFYGGEGAATLRLGPFDLGIEGAVVRARDVENDAFLVFIPPDRASLSLTYHAPSFGPGFEDTFFTVTGSYVAEQTRFDPEADLAPAPSDYALLGAAAGTSFEVDGQAFRFSVEATNLLNQRYRDYTSLLRYFADEPGLQILVRLGATFGAPAPSR